MLYNDIAKLQRAAYQMGKRNSTVHLMHNEISENNRSREMSERAQLSPNQYQLLVTLTKDEFDDPYYKSRRRR